MQSVRLSEVITISEEDLEEMSEEVLTDIALAAGLSLEGAYTVESLRRLIKVSSRKSNPIMV